MCTLIICSHHHLPDGCLRESLGEVLREPELLVVGVRRHLQLEEGAVAAVVADRALDGAGVVATVDLLQGGEVDVAVVGYHDLKQLQMVIK